MKKRLRRADLPNATSGIEDMRRRREFKRLIRTSDAAYIESRFKPRKGPRKLWWPTPWRESRLHRALKFQSQWGAVAERSGIGL